jgi:hypothetical protein
MAGSRLAVVEVDPVTTTSHNRFSEVLKRACKACGSEFETIYKKKVYCTKACYLDFWYDRLGGRKKVAELGKKRRTGPKAEQYRARKRVNWLKQAYGITLEQYKNLCEIQEGCCAICGVVPSKELFHGLHVDHDHLTGKIRGLLCRWCNSMLGRVEACPSWLSKAESYLAGEAEV